MPNETRVLAPGPSPRKLLTSTGQVLTVPDGWACVMPGDAGLTRRVKAAGPTWLVEEKKGRKRFSRGLWAPAAHIEAARAALAAERADPAYDKRLAAGRARREKEQVAYVGTFTDSVVTFLAFDARYADVAASLAAAVASHATPVGSGTVARTSRIPVEERAEAAVIAWMRHQTTGYDGMHIPREKGARREVRRMLAQRSRALLDAYRAGRDVDAARCPLQSALRR